MNSLVKRNKRNKVIDTLLKFINFDWEYIPFSQNNPLPEYLQFKYHRDILEINRIKPFRKEDKVKLYFIFYIFIYFYITIFLY